MANLVRYYFRKLGANFVDFKLDYPNSNLSLIGSDVVYVGSSGVDRVYVAKGVKFTFNNSGTGIDEIYLGGSLADYTSTAIGTSTLLLTSASKANTTITLASEDKVFFSDGSTSVKSLINYAASSTPFTLNTTENSLTLPSTNNLDSILRAYTKDPAGVVFAQPHAGVEFILTGHNGVDKVYVSKGGKVNANNLGTGVDLIFLTGNKNEYSPTAVGTSVLVLTKGTERVTLASEDRVIFADGSTLVKAAITAASGANWQALSLDSNTRTPGLVTDTQAPAMPTLALGAGVSDGTTAAEATAATGVVSVLAESGSTVLLTFSDSASPVHTLVKTLTGNGSAQSVQLDSTDIGTNIGTGPASLQDGSITITATATDAAGNTSTAGTASFTLDTLAPSINASSFAVNENTQAVGTATLSNADSVTWALAGNGADNALFAIDPASGAITWLAASGPDFEAATQSAAGSNSYTLSVSATDAAGNQSTQTISVTLTDVNDAPVNTLPVSAPAINEDTATAITGVSVHDEDLSPNGITSVQVSVERGTLHVSADAANGLAVAAISTNDTKSITLIGSETAINATLGSLSYTGNLNYHGSDTLRVLSTDAGGRTASNDLNLTVTPVNDAPTVRANAPSSLAFFKNLNNSTLNLADVFADVDSGDALTYSITSGSLPAGLNLANGIVSGTPSSNATSDTITFTATDSGSLSVNQAITLNVNSRPEIQSISVFDSDAGSANKFGSAGVSVTLQITFNEELSANGSLDAAHITANFSTAGTAIGNVSYQSMTTVANKTVLTFTGTLPAGNDTSVTLTSLTLSAGLTLSNSGGIALEAVQTGLNIFDSYVLDNIHPTTNSDLRLVVRNANNDIKNSTGIKSGDKVQVIIDFSDSLSSLNGVPAANAVNNSVFLLEGSTQPATWSTNGNSLLLSWTAGATVGNLTVDTTQLRSALTGFGITDLAGNTLAINAAFTPPASLTVDNTPPALNAATALGLSLLDANGMAITTGRVNAGDKIKLDINFGESVAGLSHLPTNGSSVNSIFKVGGLPVGAVWSQTGNMLSLTYTVAASDNGPVLLDVPALRSILDTANITDQAGNALSIPLDLEATNTALKAKELALQINQTVDNFAPVAPSVAYNPALPSTTHNWSTNKVHSNGFGITPTTLFTVTTELGSTITATFTDSAGLPLVKTVHATNSYEVNIDLSSADFGNGDNQIGTGLIKASFVTTDPAGNAGTPTLLTFYCDSFSAPEAVQMGNSALAWPVGAGMVSIATTVKAPMETNIKTLSIQVAPALGSAALDEHDLLFLENTTGHSLGSDFNASEVTLGGVSHLNYSYVASTRTLSISPDNHPDVQTFYTSPADVSAVLAAIRYGRDNNPAAGTFGRSFTIDYIDNSATPLHAAATATSTGTWTDINAGLVLSTMLDSDAGKALDVRSNLVFTASVPVNAVAGGVLTLVDNGPAIAGGSAYGGEHNTNTYRITLGNTLTQSTWSRYNGSHWTDPVVDAQLLTLDASGTHISVNLPNDLDFSSSYTLNVAPGAFTARSDGGLNGTALSASFNTVTPATDKDISTALGQSWALEGSGQWVSSYIWKDMTGWGNPDSRITLLDLSSQASSKLAFVAADKDPEQPLNNNDGKTGIGLSSMNLALFGFNENKLIYVDDLGRNEIHGPSALANIYQGAIPTFYQGNDATRLDLSTPSSSAEAVNASYLKITLDSDTSQTQADLYLAIGTSNPFYKNTFYPDFTAWSHSVGAPEHTSLWIVG